MKKIVAVTGAGGFLGRALTTRLAQEGCEVRALDNNFRGNLKTIPTHQNIKSVFCDVLDYNSVKEALLGCEEIFHLAAINGTENFYNIPDKVLEVGIIGTHNVAKACIELGLKRMTFASSSEAYNTPDHIPTREDVVVKVPDVFNARFSYGGGKLAGELIVINYLRNSKTKFTIFRPHNVIGPEMGFEHVIPQFVKKIFLASKESSSPRLDIQIQGDGTETRSFIFVEDAVSGIIIAAKQPESGLFHIGTEDEHSISDLLITVGAVVGKDVNPIPSAIQKGSPLRRCPDTSKIRSLGFKAKDDYKSSVKKTVDWYWNHFSNN